MECCSTEGTWLGWDTLPPELFPHLPGMAAAVFSRCSVYGWSEHDCRAYVTSQVLDIYNTYDPAKGPLAPLAWARVMRLCVDRARRETRPRRGVYKGGPIVVHGWHEGFDVVDDRWCDARSLEENAEAVRHALAFLPDKERAAVMVSFGFLDSHPCLAGKSKQWAHALKVKGLTKLRAIMGVRARAGFPPDTEVGDANGGPVTPRG